jgi:hypothetical protein
MFLTRDQKIACDVAREHGYNPSNVLVLCARHSQHNGAVLSVSAVKDGARYNLRVLVKKVSGSLLGADKLTVVFKKQSRNPNECVIDTIDRSPVVTKES